MPDLDQIKQEEQGVTGPARAVRQGRSGNPAGRPRGLPRPRQPRCPFAARRRGRGTYPQSRRTGAHPAALRLQGLTAGWARCHPTVPCSAAPPKLQDFCGEGDVAR